MGGDDPVIFSHVVLVLQSVPEIIAFMDQILSSLPHSSTQLILITDLAQRRSIMEQGPRDNYEQLAKEQRLRFIFKPLKPSKFAVIFDPRKEREMSTDRNQDSAQQVAVSQKQVYEEMTRRLKDKGKRVLLVEDNRVNQMVSMGVTVYITGLLTMRAGITQVLEQSQHTGGDGTGRCTVHGKSLLQTPWILFDYPCECYVGLDVNASADN